MTYNTEKVHLSEARELPLCPSCDRVLEQVRWHTVKKGPPVTYLVALTCGQCGVLLDCLSAGGAAAAAVIAMS